MYKIVITPNPVLISKASEVKNFDKKLLEVSRQMEQTLLATSDPIGVGLAAPQVGVPMRIFQMKPNSRSRVTTYVNPVIKNISSQETVPDFTNSEKVEAKKPKKSKGKLLEGCLSIPNIWGNVLRKREVTLTYQDINGKSYTKTFKGFPAVIIQHEVDHLNGILFTKHVIEQNEQLYKSRKNEKGEDEFDEIEI